jgi:tRNA (mo5U34)-methyltransferase
MAATRVPATAGAEDLHARVAALRWHHKIDLGDGLVTPGLADRSTELEATLPDLAGQTVLDIGAWDGYYSFLAERRGAARVVALDHYVWGVDLHERNVYWDDCKARGVMPEPALDETRFWRDDLPGRRSFELAHATLQSNVETHVADFMTADLGALGRFDVVLYLGVLYHITEPFTALQRLRSVTGKVAVIETEGLYVPGYSRNALLRFFPLDDLAGDFGNWFAMSETALHAMCRAAGFRRVETKVGPPGSDDSATPLTTLARRARARLGRTQPVDRYRLVVHAHV